jgi:hypothetical protein
MFEGNFNGNGKIINNLTINKPDYPDGYYQGLFGVINNATIKNVGVENCDVTGNMYVGGLVGLANNEIGNTIIENCYTTGTITSGYGSCGGLVGQSSANGGNGTIRNCYSTCDVTSAGPSVGGLLGSMSYSGYYPIYPTIEFCYTSGNLQGDYAVGGLSGNGGNIINCIAANPSITGMQNISVCRISEDGGTLQNNYAVENMIVTDNTGVITVTPNINGNAGANASITALTSFNFYNSSSNWQTAAWSIALVTDPNPEKAWKICDDAAHLPYLQWQENVACDAPTYSITLSQTELKDFGSETEGYAPITAHSVVITNIGNQPTGILTATLSGADAGSFTLSVGTIVSIAVGENYTFTVKPNDALPVGVYEATVTVSGGNGISESFNVKFTVTVAPTYGIALSQTELKDFGTVAEGSSPARPDGEDSTRTGRPPTAP